MVLELSTVTLDPVMILFSGIMWFVGFVFFGHLWNKKKQVIKTVFLAVCGLLFTGLFVSIFLGYTLQLELSVMGFLYGHGLTLFKMCSGSGVSPFAMKVGIYISKSRDSKEDLDVAPLTI